MVLNALEMPHAWVRLSPEMTRASKSESVTQAVKVMAHTSCRSTPIAETGSSVLTFTSGWNADRSADKQRQKDRKEGSGAEQRLRRIFHPR